jgi:Fic family protein
LAEAKAAVLTLQTMPFQRSWVEDLQRIQLKMEVAGTSRIEGAEFTDRELDAVLKETPEQMATRSQRQAYAALQAYKWIATLPNDLPITPDLVRKIHRLIITGADDDHCPPGELRTRDHNVNFGSPRHRGCEGGEECVLALEAFAKAAQTEYTKHDRLIQALAVHYHLAAMHPFLDGNGRTARALEALMLQRAGLRDISFIAMSNYYYDEKTAYLAALAAVRRGSDHDLTPFLIFGLRGVTTQAKRLLAQIRREMQKALFRNIMFDLFTRLRTPRKRVIADRQLEILKLLLAANEPVALSAVTERLRPRYSSLRNPEKGQLRDIMALIHLGAIETVRGDRNEVKLGLRLQWPTEITETAFFERLKALPKAKTYAFLQ